MGCADTMYCGSKGGGGEQKLRERERGTHTLHPPTADTRREAAKVAAVKNDEREAGEG